MYMLYSIYIYINHIIPIGKFTHCSSCMYLYQIQLVKIHNIGIVSLELNVFQFKFIVLFLKFIFQ